MSQGDENSCHFVNFGLFARVFKYHIYDVFLGSKMIKNISLLLILEVTLVDRGCPGDDAYLMLILTVTQG